MVRQNTTSRNLNVIAAAALIGIGLVILSAQLDRTATQCTNLLGPAATAAVELLPSIVPAAWQAVQALAFDHQQFSLCPIQMLVSIWPLLHAIAESA